MMHIWKIFCLLLAVYSERSSSTSEGVNNSPDMDATMTTVQTNTTEPLKPSLAVQATSPLAENLTSARVVSIDDSGLFPTCKPECTNNGTCRSQTDTKQPTCVCPLDFEGESCSTSSIKPLETCTESTCGNGGYCAGTKSQPICTCPKWVSGTKCERRLRSYEVTVSLLQEGAPMNWNKSLADPSNPVFIKTAQRVLRQLQLSVLLGDDFLLVSSYRECRFDGFVNGSVTALASVKFDFNDTLARQFTEQKVMDHLLSGEARSLGVTLVPSAQKIAALQQIDTKTISVKVANPCSFGNHDCSQNAVCLVIPPGTYTCACKTFTVDTSPNSFYPGRRCMYDGLIILAFVIVGCLLSMLVFVACGCRRTIWHRYRNRGAGEHVTLVKMAANYDI